MPPADSRLTCLCVVAAFLVALASIHVAPAFAWGDRAHQVIGVLAVEQASKATRLELAEVLGSLNAGPIGAACNWPDRYRALGVEAAWSAPLHYVNIDAARRSYLASRDCPDGQCLPIATARYAQRLGDRTLSRAQRAEAFSFLCHFVGDLHQPLHVGFVEDRGGTRVTVYFEGEEINLHWFWDGALIEARSESWQELAQRLRERPQQAPAPNWRPSDIDTWTNESFTFTRNLAYPGPEGRELSGEFAERSWRIVLNQLDTSAARLASILDAVLVPADVE